MPFSAPASSTSTLHPVLAGRWSPRGLDAHHQVGAADLETLLQAARWAPSANNSQPWRFLVATRGSGPFQQLLDALAPGNQLWAHAAGALVLAAAETVDAAGAPHRWAEYDTGQAVAALSLQAHALGLHVRQMGGFDAERVRGYFGLHDTLAPLVVVAVGRHDPDASLPQALAERETAPRSRQSLDALLLAPFPEAGTRAA